MRRVFGLLLDFVDVVLLLAERVSELRPTVVYLLVFERLAWGGAAVPSAGTQIEMQQGCGVVAGARRRS